MRRNHIYPEDCIPGMAAHLSAETVDLIVADPPYFKVVGEKWDYQWRTEEDYIQWSVSWFEQAARVLRLGGSFYLFGYFRILSLDGWKEYDRILEYPVYVYPRRGERVDRFPGRITVLEPPTNEQYEIDKKLQEILPVIDRYAKSQETLDKLNVELLGNL